MLKSVNKYAQADWVPVRGSNYGEKIFGLTYRRTKRAHCFHVVIVDGTLNYNFCAFSNRHVTNVSSPYFHVTLKLCELTSISVIELLAYMYMCKLPHWITAHGLSANNPVKCRGVQSSLREAKVLSKHMEKKQKQTIKQTKTKKKNFYDSWSSVRYSRLLDVYTLFDVLVDNKRADILQVASNE